MSSSSSDSSSSSSDDEVEKPREKAKAILNNPFASAEAKTMPRPSFMVEQEEIKSNAHCRENSVFQNPFRVKEDQKKAMLERHVEMTTKNEEKRTIDGKKVCWNFRKGRCRFGSKCTFAHDNDVPSKKSHETPDQIVMPNQPSRGSEPGPADEGVVIENNKRPKKRPGLSNSIVPGKKAMKFHDKVYGNPK